MRAHADLLSGLNAILPASARLSEESLAAALAKHPSRNEPLLFAEPAPIFSRISHAASSGAAAARSVSGAAKRKREDVSARSTKKPLRVPHVPRTASGAPVLPLQVGSGFTLVSLGTVRSDNPLFHCDRYIYPVGYYAIKEYHSTESMGARSLYHCRIHDGGLEPVFEVRENDDPTRACAASSATGAWSRTVDLVNRLRSTDLRVSGPNHFGLTNRTIAFLIDELPGVADCKQYTPVNVVEGPESAPKSQRTLAGFATREPSQRAAARAVPSFAEASYSDNESGDNESAGEAPHNAGAGAEHTRTNAIGAGTMP